MITNPAITTLIVITIAKTKSPDDCGSIGVMYGGRAYVECEEFQSLYVINRIYIFKNFGCIEQSLVSKQNCIIILF